MNIKELGLVLVGVLIGFVAVGILYFTILGVKFYWYTEVKGYVLTMPAGGFGEVNQSGPRIEFGPATLESTVITESEDDLSIEEFVCEFNPPLKHITIIGHYYPDYVMLNEEYWEFNPDEDEEVWGWSNCIWQPDDDWAGCDVYLKIPDTVVDVGDYAIETGGHEYWHAACGDFHSE